VGTKIDSLPENEWKTYKNTQAEDFCKDFGIKHIFYTSAKKRINIDEAFGKIADIVSQKDYEPEPWSIRSIIRLENENNLKSNTGTGYCCNQ